jgi:hypothetical protein
MLFWRKPSEDLAELEAELTARDASVEVSERWADLEASLTELAKSDPIPSSEPPRDWIPLLPLVSAIRVHPVLGKLSAFRSLWFLCLNRCTKYPFSDDYPAIRPGDDGLIEVYVHPWTLVGSGDATEAVRLLVEHLPPDCGPAIDGDVDDLRRIERGIRKYRRKAR